ncbi:cytochrome c oxidase assembly protein [Niveispirillum sp.]|uniref:cytochrome c oxidase assembly protein n=1 Tax=Niveispirillum sp. TaxID=1917217 RepID=UPI001B777ABC|nr:cytochrome c oxidase assembly protein [Niveispirillum sp.]MBP7338969.1 cytochrome c oxidase assembly protein [Niveispirillum sp.]
MTSGFLTAHMTSHIVAMNLLAPALVLAAQRFLPVTGAPLWLPAATFCQMTLLWGWHMPVVLEQAMHSPMLMALMHLSLFVVACWFWTGIVAAMRQGEWQPLPALLITGKLFCLLGVLLVFAPRPIYAMAGPVDPMLLVDQQFAGLLMLTACPLVYVSVAIITARRWLRRVDSTAWRPARNGGDAG